MNKSKLFVQKHKSFLLFILAQKSSLPSPQKLRWLRSGSAERDRIFLGSTYSQLCSLLLAMTFLLGLSWPIVAQSATASQFLPLFANQNTFRANTPQPPTCEFTSSTQALATLFKTDPSQMRPTMTCNPILMQVAQARVEDMAANNYFGHINLSGQGPNYLVREAGYDLAPHYSTAVNVNEIESLAAGSMDSAAIVWEQWLQSSTHRTHVLGLGSHFQQQRDYGIGYVYDLNSRYKRYWILITAEPANLQ